MPMIIPDYTKLKCWPEIDEWIQNQFPSFNKVKIMAPRHVTKKKSGNPPRKKIHQE